MPPRSSPCGRCGYRSVRCYAASAASPWNGAMSSRFEEEIIVRLAYAGRSGGSCEMGLDPVLPSRFQFAFTLLFHIVFPAFTIGLSAYIATLGALWVRSGEQRYNC